MPLFPIGSGSEPERDCRNPETAHLKPPLNRPNGMLALSPALSSPLEQYVINESLRNVKGSRLKLKIRRDGRVPACEPRSPGLAGPGFHNTGTQMISCK